MKKYDPTVWSELDDGVGIAASAAKHELIAQFVSELCIEVGIDLIETFADMQTPYVEHIEYKVADYDDPCDFYVRCIEAADDYWAQAVRYEISQSAGETQGSDVTHSAEATADIESRLDHLESLWRNGVLSEIENRRARNRILDEI